MNVSRYKATSDPTSMLADYLKMMTTLSEFSEKADQYDTGELHTAYAFA